VKRCILIAVVCGLAACAGAPKVPERAVYDLAIPAEPATVPVEAPLRVTLTLSSWFDSGEIAYRLLYDDPWRLRAYAASRWAGRPSQLIAARLKERLSQGTPRCSVRVEVDEFAQHFVRVDRSEQVLAAQVSLRGPNGEVLRDERRRLSVAADSADTRGGIAAAAQVVDQFAAALAASAALFESCRSR
jgi:cholesterol transport system auxiliary component